MTFYYFLSSVTVAELSDDELRALEDISSSPPPYQKAAQLLSSAAHFHHAILGHFLALGLSFLVLCFKE